jgi:hypothetical protein
MEYQLTGAVNEIMRMVTPYMVGIIGFLFIRLANRIDDDIKEIRNDHKQDNKFVNDRVTALSESFSELSGQHKRNHRSK